MVMIFDVEEIRAALKQNMEQIRTETRRLIAEDFTEMDRRYLVTAKLWKPDMWTTSPDLKISSPYLPDLEKNAADDTDLKTLNSISEDLRFHQVDSYDLTIAVNFWWKSNIMSNMLEHMDAYYLRRILNRLVGNEMNSMLQMSSASHIEERKSYENANEASKGDCYSKGQIENVNGSSKKHWSMLQQLEPIALSMLYKLISLVHDAVKVSDCNEVMERTPVKDSHVSLIRDCTQTAVDNPSVLVNDPVSSIFSALEPLVLKKVLQAMAHQFPRTLEALILHVLSPTAAEILTHKFDEMDQQMTNEQQVQFYQLFYSVFDDPNVAMDAILRGKEAFTFQALRNVLDQYLGLHIDTPS